MNIGFDAKRAFHNQTGLGHYSRTLIQSLSHSYSANEYFLFNPKPSGLFHFDQSNVHEVRPHNFPSTIFPALWRSSWVKSDLKELNIDLYHGLSHEIPVGIRQTSIPAVVTMHDLIHERYPEQYPAIDVKIYNRKFRYACANADRIIAISEQTKKDIIAYYGTDGNMIDVTYQSCNPAFGEAATSERRAMVRRQYQLPKQYFLYVGSIIGRKNLMNVCKAMFMLRNDFAIPLVVIGDGGKYKQAVKDFVRQNNLESRIIFLSDSTAARQSPSFQTGADLPVIYQCAIAMIYPSFFEGFGIPVLESLLAGLPVITSKLSSMPEVGGDAACYVDPRSAEEIAQAMIRIATDRDFATSLETKGREQAKRFAPAICAQRVMSVYQQLTKNHH
ncbi:MAG TPA: glycosyltransferase family 1 protein [Chitinophagaceae bacterium]